MIMYGKKSSWKAQIVSIIDSKIFRAVFAYLTLLIMLYGIQILSDTQSLNSGYAVEKKMFNIELAELGNVFKVKNR